MKALLRTGFLALAIVLAQVFPANANPINWRQECKIQLIEAKKNIDSKKRGKYVFSRSDRRKAKQYYNEAVNAHNNKQYDICANIALGINMNHLGALMGTKLSW